MKHLIEHIKNSVTNVWVQFLLFSSSLWLVFVHLQINRYIKDGIIGLHYWRKSDTLSQIHNYYYNGLRFFDHSIYYNQLETAGKAVAEFPLFYYFVALQQTLFGPHEIIAKINWIVLLFFGLFALFKIANHFIKHFALSLLSALSIFLSPVFVFYAIDFLPDPVALNFLFIGLWFLLKSTCNNKKSTLISALIFLSIAGMVKPFFFIPYLAFLLLTVINQFWLKKQFCSFKFSYLIPLAFITLWFIYTNWYNNAVNTDYFLSKPRPIWKYSDQEVAKTWLAIQEKWLNVYLIPQFVIPFLVLVVTNLVWWTKETFFYTSYYLLCCIGCVLFFILFFNMFEHHDYYVYPLLFILPLTIGVFIYQLKKTIQKKWITHLLAFGLIILFTSALNTVWSINQARRKAPHLNSIHHFENYKNLDFFLAKNGVTPQSYVMAFSDKSPSFALSLMKRKGWSGFQTMTYQKNVQHYIDKGADFLIINRRVPTMSDSLAILGFTAYPIADSNDIVIYDLKPYQQ